jgi:DNA-binding NarL/FixJ family response regulator
VIEPVSVLIAEDHAIVREGTREMLERHPGIHVIGEAADGPMAVTLTEALHPDVLLLDLGLPTLNGIEVTRQVRQMPDPPAVLVLSAYDEPVYVHAALAAGAGGYLSKTAHARDVVAAIAAVARGEVVLDADIARRILGHPSSGRGPSLSARDLDVLRSAARGLSTKEIAAELRVSTRTVESHLTSIFNKLGVTNRIEAVVTAVASGWLTPDAGPLPR